MSQKSRAIGLFSIVWGLILCTNCPWASAQSDIREQPTESIDHFMMEQRALPGASSGGVSMGKGRIYSGDGSEFDERYRQYLDEGRYDKLERLIRRRIDQLEREYGANAPRVATAIKNLALVYHLQAKYDDASRLYEHSLKIQRQAHGPVHPDVALVMSQLAEVYQAQGQLTEAGTYHKEAVQILQKTRGHDHLDLGLAYNNLARFYFVEKQYGEAEQLFRKALRIFEMVRDPNHSDLALAHTNLALVHQIKGRHNDAEFHFLRARDIFHALGAERPDLAVALYNLAELSADQRKWPEALEYYNQATQIITNQVRRGPLSDGINNIPWNRSALSGNINAAWEVANASHERQALLADQSFRLAQWIARTTAAGALAQMSARQAKGDSKLSRLVRQRQDLVREWEALDKQLLLAISQLSDDRDVDVEEAKRNRLAKINEKLRELDGRLSVQFPQYTELANPAPLSINDVQDLLRGDEALVLFGDTTDEKHPGDQAHIWVVTKSDSRWVRSTIDTASLSREVGALRCGLDAITWYGEGVLKCASLLGIDLDKAPDAGALPPFDAVRAHNLYRSLFGKIEDLISGKQLLIVPSGALTALPLQTLVVEAQQHDIDAGTTDYTQVKWLGQRQAITVLPSVASLKALRTHAKEKRTNQPFIGFGNPLLTGPDGNDRRAWAKQNCLQPRRPRPHMRLAAIAPKQKLSSFFRSGLADVEEVRQQVPLPETADELCAVARATGVEPPFQMVHLGARATETQIKKLSEIGSLAQARVVHFATHGLIAGETADLTRSRAEPALVLTPPKKATEKDDGLLTASEVANLKLNADWVVLSACNTAAGDTIGGDAFSGLARAFFYAGARALLVSHWYVDSQATVSLITIAFEALKRDPKIGRAEAMRRAMADLIKRGGRSAHPANWAPFVVVGEGN